jgi:4-amino-4-deoxy-L-arabinose transferase-like glycosyltransferase
MEKGDKLLAVFIIFFFILRLYIASSASFGFYYGLNEASYAGIAKNYFVRPLWRPTTPYYTSTPVNLTSLYTPPFFSYLVFASYNLFGISDLSARLVSLLAEMIAVLGIYFLAKELFNKKIARLSVIFFILQPWNVAGYGVAQTDPLQTTLMIVAITFFIRAYKYEKSMLPFGIAFGIGVFTKQPAAAVVLILGVWILFEGVKKHLIKKAILCMIIGLLPFIAFLSYNLLMGEYKDVEWVVWRELFRSPGAVGGKTVLFENVPRVTLALIGGASPFLLLAALYGIFKMENRRRDVLLIWLLIYGSFVFIRTPYAHDYYIFPLLPPLAILSAKGALQLQERFHDKHNMIIALLILLTIPISYSFLVYTGTLGYRCTEDVGIYLSDYIGNHPNETFLVLSHQMSVAYFYMSNLPDEIEGIHGRNPIEIAKEYNVSTVFIVTDDRKVESKLKSLERVYTCVYKTNLPPLPGFIDSRFREDGHFGAHLNVYKL